ncbi:MAG: hypothetical protein JW940_37190 [Polyangiaceae bacterium]|nr:hypothetical protein [Polyangiaceae bacterium]
MPGAAVPVDLSPASKATLEALQSVSSLAWSILKTQARMLGLDPARLRPSDRNLLAPRLVDAIRRFGSEAKAQQLTRILERQGVVSAAPRGSRPSGRVSNEPPGPMSRLALQVLQELQRFSALAWPLFEAQCTRHGISPGDLSRSQLGDILPDIEKCLTRFASPEKAKAARKRLEELVARR